MKTVLARDVMTTTVFVVEPNATVAHARNLMVRHRISRLPVMDAGNLAGIITKKDIAYRLRQGEPAWRRRPLDRIPVGVLMTEKPLVVAPDTGVREIARMFAQENISSVPVVDEGVVVGIVTKSDLMKSALVRALDCPARDVMEDAATVSRYHSLDHVVGVMSERHDKVLVLDDDGALAGIITETNLAFYDDEPKISGVVGKDVTIQRRGTASGKAGQTLMVIPAVAAEDLMTSPVITVDADTILPDAIALMEKHHVNSLVVMDKSTIAGILKRDDIIKEVAK